MGTIGAIILAAGKGSRMKLDGINKVTLPVNKKPMIQYAVDLLRTMDIATIIVVVGHAKESVMEVLKTEQVLFADQKAQLGTAHAVETALEILPSSIKDVFVLQGDDAMFYSKKILETLLVTHQQSEASITLVTLKSSQPYGIGRIQRDGNNNIVGIIEEKDASDEQKKNGEINPACYLFNVAFLRNYLKKVEKSSITGEYYLTQLIEVAIQHHQKVETVSFPNIPWRGVNTKEELQQAEQMLS